MNDKQAQEAMTTPVEPTPMDLAFSEQRTAIALRLALEIFLQVPSLAAVEAIDEGVSAYHEAWIRGRKRVL